MTNDNTVSCEAKRGFFTLYDCAKPGTRVCSRCRRKLCTEHYPEKLNNCLECEAKQNRGIDFTSVEKSNKDGVATEKPLQNLLATYQYRQKFFKKDKGKAIYLGQNLNDYYKPYDLRSFHVELSNIADMADSPDEVFFDS